MPRCTGITKGGTRCKLEAIEGSSYCWSHSPEGARARQARARRGGTAGGRGRAKDGEIEALKKRAARLYDDVRGGKVRPGVGSVLVQTLNCQVRVWEAERRARLAEAEVVTMEQLRREMELVAEVLVNHVQDREVLDAVLDELRRIDAARHAP